MSSPQFPDPAGRRELVNPGATAHKAGLSLEDRLKALERGAAARSLSPQSLLTAQADIVTRNAGVPVRESRALVSSLPGSPYDGQQCYFQNAGMATDGIVWVFRYNAASASAYKWELISGNVWEVTRNTIDSRAGTSYGSYGTTLQRVTPLAGDYYVHHTAWMGTASASAVQYDSFSVGGTGALDADAIVHQQTTTAITGASHGHRVVRKDAIAASTTLTEQVRTTAGTANSGWRSFGLLPVRVG